MKKQLIIFAAALLVGASALAVPAKRTKTMVRQPDGTMLMVMVVGDEHHHFTCTEDRQPVVRNVDGAYCYARLSDGGIVEPTSQLAHNVADRSASEKSFLERYSSEAVKVRSIGQERRAANSARRIARMAKRNDYLNRNEGLKRYDADKHNGVATKSAMAGATGGEDIGVTGKRKGLVILVNFKDKAMLAANSQAEWNRYFNEVGYSKNGNSGSVHDYFTAQSYGQFDLEFDVVGPVTVSKNMSAYGGNDRNGNDVDPGGMVYEACKLADSQVNFADYDWDGDGEVDQVYLIYAGYGEASGTEDNPIANTIWQHEWTLSDQDYSLTLDGVRIDTYGCSSELTDNTGTKMDGIGTACHEFSHCLGIPDFYDTEYNGGFGMGSWDLMDYGSYLGDGYRPACYNTYERWVSGWMQPTELKEPCFVSGMKALNDAPEAYVVYNEKTPTEYYILENRQQTGLDSELPASGMLVIHVDYNKQSWENNTVNNTKSHQRFSIVPADNKLTEYTESGDTYPGSSMNTSLTDTSSPAATLFNANSDNRRYLGKPITQIKESADGLISFTFMNGIKLDTPTELVATDVSNTSFTATWNPVTDAESYALQLRKKGDQPTAEESLAVAEDFTTWGKGFKGDSTTDISGELDEHTVTPGWTGEKVFECPGCIKLGSSKATGNITAPIVSTHVAKSVTVALVSKAYGNDAAGATISLIDANGSEIASKSITPDGTLVAVVLANPDEKDYRVMIKPRKRSYIYSIGVYNGEFSADDLATSDAAKTTILKVGQSVSDISGITTTSYKFDNLDDQATYQWRVRAVAGDIMTPWSGWQTVTLGENTGISQLAQLSNDSIVTVSSISGLSFGKMTKAEFLANPFFRGTFILTTNGKSMTVAK